jgi:hypothetical protein
VSQAVWNEELLTGISKNLCRQEPGNMSEEEFRRRAAEAEEQARICKDEAEKTVWLRIAAEWRTMIKANKGPQVSEPSD